MNKRDPACNGYGYINYNTLEDLQKLTRLTPVHRHKPSYGDNWSCAVVSYEEGEC